MKDDLERDLDLLALAEGGASLSQERRQQLESEIAASKTSPRDTKPLAWS